MTVQILLKADPSGRGGPAVWAGRFGRILARRGYTVTADQDADWRAALFVNNVVGMEQVIGRGKPVVYRVAGGYLPPWFQAMGRSMKPEHHMANATIAHALQMADTVIYQSHWAKTELDLYLHARSDRFAVIYNGVDLTHFHPLESRSGGVPVIGSVGLLRYRYRLATLFEMSRNLETPHRLLIVGSVDDECAEVLRHYQADPLIGPRLSYRPYVPPGELPALYQQLSLLVHPVCGDVCPNVVVEALACGVPVVAPRYGGTAELVGPAGVIFDCQPWVYDEAFVTAMTAAVAQGLSYTADLALQARQRAVAELDLEKMADRYLATMGLPPQSPRPLSESSQPLAGHSLPKQLRQAAARSLVRPRFYTAVALRKFHQARRRLFPPPPHSRPRIAFTLYDFHVGGIENWLYRLAGALQDEFDFYFLATKVPDFLPKFDEVGTCAYLPNSARLTAYLQRYQIDIVQVHNERWPIDAALAAGVPHVIERTDGTRSCARVPKHGLSLVIASSQATVPLIARHFPAERIYVVYNGIDLNEVDAAPVKRPYPPDTFVIGRTSRFGRGKNLGLLIEAIQELHGRYPHLKLILIGGDSLMPGAEPIEAALRTQAAPLGERVQFLGVKENVLPWIKGFDVGTCVSDPENEGIPNSLIEAMACCKPVIATNVDQVDELVAHEVNGLLIPPGDIAALCRGIEQLANNPDFCRQLGAAGRRTIEEHFSLQQAAAQYAAIYRQLLAV